MAAATPTLILLPGMDGTGELFRPIQQVLAPNWHCRVVSYPTHEEASYEELRPLVEAALPQAPYVLVAESFSGPLAVMVAAQRPAALQAVVLCASFVCSPLGRVARMFLPLVQHATQLRPPAFAIAAGLLGFGAPKALNEAVGAAIEQVSAMVLAHRLEQLAAVDVRALAGLIQVPVLYLQASHDRLVGRGSLRQLERVCQQLQVTELTGPHLLLQRCPAAAVAAIEAFVSRAAGG